MHARPPFRGRRRFLAHTAAAVASGLAVPGTGFAQGEAYPARPIRIVCNFPAGSSPDALVRAIALPLQQSLAQPVVIDDRAGASGMIGGDLVAKSPPDGYTLLITPQTSIAVAPALYGKAPYDAARDFGPSARLGPRRCSWWCTLRFLRRPSVTS
jgi:tripartite-type tricarboxylate transporter receptor subunit TctC